jgi:hypothetical protein
MINLVIDIIAQPGRNAPLGLGSSDMMLLDISSR